MGDYPTFGQKKTPFLGSGVSSAGEPLLVQKNQAVFDRHAYEPGQVVHIQLGHQVGPLLLDGFHATVNRVILLSPVASRKPVGSTSGNGGSNGGVASTPVWKGGSVSSSANTGVAPARAAIWLATKGHIPPGAHPPKAILDPVPFFKELEQREI